MTNIPKHARLFTAVFVVMALPALTFAADLTPSQAADTSTESSSGKLEEITVTARKREEKLQDVPDAITVLTAGTIENAGIQHLADIVAMTPNLDLRDGSAYSSGFFNLSMRGIGEAQQGWPSVAFIVDGVPADSPEILNNGTLDDIERIEILRGPQSALYGSGAIAGAINVVTKRPTNDFEVETRLFYGNGDDRQAGVTLSGAIVPDKILVRIAANYTDDVGLIRSASNGIPLDFKDQRQIQGRVIFLPVDNFEADISGSYVKQHYGASYEEVVPSIAYINDFSSAYDPREATAGYDDDLFERFSARLRLDLDYVSLTSVSSYAHTTEYEQANECWDDPNNPAIAAPGGGVQCFGGIAHGASATPGQIMYTYFDPTDNWNSFFEDLRVASRSAGNLQWIVGGSFMHRKRLDGYVSGDYLAPNAINDLIYAEWDGKDDKWWGVYGQVQDKLTDAWELSFEARYDDQRYTDTRYTNAAETVVVPVVSPNGTPVDTLVERASAFQPKGQISYHFDSDRMAYVTVSKGFRAGFFDTGAYAQPEHTVNYEVGFKSMWLEHRLSANVAAFHIDYSDQQTSNILDVPPYRVPVTIPKTSINGVEYESVFQVTNVLSLSAGLGYLDAVVADGTPSPAAPHFDGTLSAQIMQPLAAGWRLNARGDFRFHSSEFLYIDYAEQIPDRQYFNARVGIENDRYGIYAVGRNLTNEREAQIHASTLPDGEYIRYENEPRSYGVELRGKF